MVVNRDSLVIIQDTARLIEVGGEDNQQQKDWKLNSDDARQMTFSVMVVESVFGVTADGTDKHKPNFHLCLLWHSVTIKYGCV